MASFSKVPNRRSKREGGKKKSIIISGFTKTTRAHHHQHQHQAACTHACQPTCTPHTHSHTHLWFINEDPGYGLLFSRHCNRCTRFLLSRRRAGGRGINIGFSTDPARSRRSNTEVSGSSSDSPVSTIDSPATGSSAFSGWPVPTCNRFNEGSILITTVLRQCHLSGYRIRKTKYKLGKKMIR